ncbi:phage tail assembly protein [Acinetobacter sp. WZC-1]|uniref:phage tail assembly protein n=1 Tax=Acinetobacter sp. WZC-1 TaxID=3459034 RepID=UPI00403DA58C
MTEKTEEQLQNQEATQDPNVTTVDFDIGFKRGENMIKQVDVRKPKSRALRGLTVVNILQLDVDTLARLAPRITAPAMSENDVYELEPADLTKLCKTVIGFFVSTTDDDFQ